MEKEYFKGELVSYRDMSKVYHNGYEGTLPKSKLDFFIADIFLQKPLKTYTCNYELTITDPEIIELLDKDYELRTKYLADIIFEIVYDEFDKPYAKEIVTGTVFPIVDQDDFTRTYKATYKVEEINKDSNTNKLFACDYRLEAEPIHQIKNPNILNLMYFVRQGCFRYSTQIELDEYKTNFYPHTIFGMRTKTKNKKLVETFRKFYNNNTYKNNNFKTEKPPEVIVERQTQSEYTILMENIEFLLTQLGKIDLSLKKIMCQKYNLLLEGEDKILTLEPLTKERLKSFEAELEFIIKTNKKENQDVVECLDNIIAEYNEETKTPRTIKDIDKLSELFLKMKDSYSITTQRKVIEKFACVYIHEIYENKDTIKIEDLANSYFNDILKSIIIYISEMLEHDAIENNIIVNYTDITPNYVLELIKQLKFKKVKNKQRNLVN